MILLTGIPSEPPLALVTRAAEALSVPFILFNQRLAAHEDFSLLVEPNGRGTEVRREVRIASCDYDINDFSGIYVRLTDHQSLPELTPNSPARVEPWAARKIELAHELLNVMLECTTARIMNRPSAMASNISKPYQAQLIGKVGLATPDTLITNDPDEVLKFQAEYGRIVYKSVSSVRSIVRELTGPDRSLLERVHALPTQFQALIDGTDIRVHVAGDVLFATEVDCTGVDYRYARRDGLEATLSPCTLPPEIEQACFALSEALSLPLCGIDLRRTPQEQYYCFEANPCPGYSYYQEQTGQDIAQAIVRWLEYGSARD